MSRTEKIRDEVLRLWWPQTPLEHMTPDTVALVLKLVHMFKDHTVNPTTMNAARDIGEISRRRDRMLAGPMIVPDDPMYLATHWEEYSG